MLAVIFCCICVAAVVLAFKFVRARHTLSLHVVHTGTCMYVVLFVLYEALQAWTLGQLGFLNYNGSDSIARASVQISSSAAFAALFGLGFTGKVALVQMWMHVVRQHSTDSAGAPPRLHSTAHAQHGVTRPAECAALHCSLVDPCTNDSEISGRFEYCRVQSLLHALRANFSTVVETFQLAPWMATVKTSTLSRRILIRTHNDNEMRCSTKAFTIWKICDGITLQKKMSSV
jgi:hypothetical protein